MSALQRWALVVLSGYLTGTAFIYTGGAALVANVPLFFALRSRDREGRTIRGFEAALMGGLVGFMGGLHIYGILDYGWLLLWGFALYTGSQMALFGWLLHRLWGRSRWGDILLPGLAWAVSEWIRTVGVLSMPASYVGCIADVSWLRPWLALAAVTGGIGVSTLIGVFQGVFYFGITSSTHRTPAGVILLVLMGVGAWGAIAPPPLGEQPVKVAGVQGGLPNHVYAGAQIDPLLMEAVIEAYGPLTQEAATSADLVVWPETAVRTKVLGSPDLEARLLPPADSDATLVAGLAVVTPDGLEHNRAVAVHGRQVVSFSDKVRLVPGHEARFTPGERWQAIDTPVGPVGVMICLESVFPDAGRALAADGAELLLVISNDAGFRRSPIARHMTLRAVVRAVETGRWLLRVGQSGVTTLIDPRGHTHGELPLFSHGILSGTAHRLHHTTLYVAWGDWWMYLVFSGLFWLSFRTVSRKRHD
ncbi:MAG: apolipoprotein N-acyltransferase [Bradymonadia bacterium]